MVVFTFYVPRSHLESVKEAVFTAGAGRVGDYGHCSWQTLGEGQFKPLMGANPYIGEQGQMTHVNEYRVEMVCDDAKLPAVVTAFKQAHPYEEPAYSAVRLLDV